MRHRRLGGRLNSTLPTFASTALATCGTAVHRLAIRFGALPGHLTLRQARAPASPPTEYRAAGVRVPHRGPYTCSGRE